MSKRKKKETRFLFWFLLFPVVQFLIFYIGVNFNSFLLAFQKFEDGGMVFAGFENFIEVLKDIFVTGELQLAVKNSAIQFVVATIIGMPLHILVAYMIFKKIPGHSFFKVMLFMPNMISAMVFVVCGRYLIQDGFPQIFNLPELNLLNEYADSSFYTVLIFGFWMQFAGALLIYLSAMDSISTDVMEYCKLEKMNSLQELWYIVIPSIWPTIVTYVVVGMAGFFTNQGFFYSFFGQGAKEGINKFDTLGYVFFVKVTRDDAVFADYPYAAAGGLLFTLLIAPITIMTKKLLEKYGPSEE